MKRYIFMLICTLFFAQSSHPEIGCMDNSKHLDLKDGPDYKRFHYVRCMCPCDRYAQSFKRGRCEHCRHYRAPKNVDEMAQEPEFR